MKIKSSIFVLLVIGCLFVSCKNKFSTDQKNTSEFAIMTFEKKEHNFGVINQNSIVEYTFKFKNTGSKDLLISNAQGSCGCTIPEYPKEAIKPSESGKIKVSFNSAGKSGNQQKSVTLTANTEVGKELLTINAQIK